MNASTEYRVQAKNLSHASENKIHDDDVARRFGFQGGLVPGVEVYAYMTHLPVARWGVDWLERGTAECRFSRPVYDGKVAIVSAIENGGALSLAVDSEGERCATGAAALPATPFVLSPSTSALRADAQDRPLVAKPKDERPPAFDDRPEANETTLAAGRRLSSQAIHLTQERLDQYLADIRETEPLYVRENLVHPAFMLRLCNFALKDNVKLAAWIHVGSSIRHCGLAHAGVTLTAHAVVAENYERKGHRYVDLDVVIAADGARAVAQVRHTAIYKLRQD